MSKHNKVNYSKFANNTVEEDVIEKTSIDQVEEIKENTEESIEEGEVKENTEKPIEEAAVEEEITEEISPVGVVSGCTKLNVRENPSKDANVVCEIKADSVVIINEKESTNDFYKVVTEAGAEGFCMKKFITIKW